MKKILIFALTLLLLLSCVPIASFAQEETTPPEGTPISTVEEFENMDPTGTYYLANDINFNKTYEENYILEAFNGTLDGNGKAIYGFSIKGHTTTASNSGVFGQIGTTANATVRNLTIGSPLASEGGNIKFTPNDGHENGVGIVAGYQPAGFKVTLDNITVYADTTSYRSGVTTYIGGIIGYATNAEITDCIVNGSLTNLGGGKNAARVVNLGGIIGTIPVSSNVTISGCINNANLTFIQRTLVGRIGGIASYIGASSTVTIKDCINHGSISVAPDKNDSDFVRNLTYAYVAGILADTDCSSGVTVNGCINYGELAITEYIKNSDNETVPATSPVLQFAGIMGKDKSNNIYKNCINYGKLSTTTNNTYAPICVVQGSGSTFTNCYDKTGAMSDTPATGIKTVGFQQSEPADGKFNIRFIATVDTNTYETYGFEGTAYMLDGEGKLITGDFTKQSSDCYTSIDAYADKGLKAYEAGELGGNYLIALSISNIPTATEAGTVTIVYRTFATDTEGNTVYGNTITVSFRDGVVVNHIDLSK